MKKLIAILTLFVFSLFITNAQQNSQVTYVDTLKSVTVNVSTDVNKKVVDPVQSLFAESIENQKAAQIATKEYLDTLTSLATMYINNIEAKNKSDSESITTKFGYTNTNVKQILKTERWFNILLILLGIIYLMFVYNKLRRRDYLENIVGKTIIFLLIGIIGFLLLQQLFQLLFNPGYFFMQNFIALYT
jgi:hypothetical protein